MVAGRASAGSGRVEPASGSAYSAKTLTAASYELSFRDSAVTHVPSAPAYRRWMLVVGESVRRGHEVCTLQGEVDAWTVGAFRDRVAALVGKPTVILDLCATGFLDSAGLGALIGAIRRIRDANGSVVVACSRPPLLRLLRTTGLDRVVLVVESVDEAAAALEEEEDARAPSSEGHEGQLRAEDHLE